MSEDVVWCFFNLIIKSQKLSKVSYQTGDVNHAHEINGIRSVSLDINQSLDFI